MKLVHGSSAVKSRGPDISLSGGREELPAGSYRDLNFPITAFGIYGMPKGWTNIQEIELTFGYERTHQGQEGIDVCVSGLEGRLLETPNGPRLTMEGLAEVLKEGLETLTKCNDQEASSTLLSPYKSGDLGLFIPPPHAYPRESADQILSGRIMGQTIARSDSMGCQSIGCPRMDPLSEQAPFLARTGDRSGPNGRGKIRESAG